MDDSLRLHHIGILVPDIASRNEQYTKRFGYVVESPIIEDAKQTALVQFLRLPGADHWTELVAPNGPTSVLRGALDRGKGGAHHLCYEVEDIDAQCRRLRGMSVALVSPPVAAVAFGGRRIAWLMDPDRLLIELVEAGPGPLALSQLGRSEAAV